MTNNILINYFAQAGYVAEPNQGGGTIFTSPLADHQYHARILVQGEDSTTPSLRVLEPVRSDRIFTRLTQERDQTQTRLSALSLASRAKRELRSNGIELTIQN